MQPSFNDVAPHRHSFLHIFFLWDNGRCSEICIVGSGVLHTMPPAEKCRLFLMIDPTSSLAEHLADIITDCGGLLLRPCDDMQDIPDDVPDDELRGIVREWLIRQAFVTDGGNIRAMDERIVKLVSEIREHRHLEERISEIAQQCCLSESRLSHIFMESCGISLKGYLNIARMRYAYELVLYGRSITYAALEAGFGSSAHLAAVCREQMGISISGVLR